MGTRIPVTNEHELVINALFVQPTYHCAFNCEGCYVKGMEKVAGILSNHDHINVLVKTIKKFTGCSTLDTYDKYDGKIQANQITIALDTPPLVGEEGWAQMRYFWESVRKIPRWTKCQGIAEWKTTEFHLTCFSPHVFMTSYHPPGKTAEDFFHYETDWKHWDVISFSHLTQADIPFLAQMKNIRPNVERNWNLTAFNEDWTKAHLAYFKIIAEHVDRIYYVMHKPATGEPLDIKKVKTYFDNLAKIKHQLGEDFYKKVTIDGCVQDARKFRDTGFGCSSNISRFQVWPNGSVSGCPYQQSPVTSGATSVEDVIANIRQAAKRYEFDECRIPETLHPGSERSKERIENRTRSTRFKLEIID